MRVTSLRSLETYLYSSAIVPLKELQGIYLESPSPITDSSGHTWYVEARRTPIVRRPRRNYQRRQAEANRDWQVWINCADGGGDRLIADYSIKNHWVRIYEKPFRETKSMLIYGKLHKLFVENQPFAKIISMYEPKQVRAGRRIPNPLSGETYDSIAMEVPMSYRDRFMTVDDDIGYDEDEI